MEYEDGHDIKIDDSISNASIGSNNTVFEEVPIRLDTTCFMLLGLLFCRDRNHQKAKIFYSVLRGATTTKDQSEDLYCFDGKIEGTIFKICVLSSMFIEYNAMPTRPGKTEIKMLQMAFAMRTSILFKVFQTFI